MNLDVAAYDKAVIGLSIPDQVDAVTTFEKAWRNLLATDIDDLSHAALQAKLDAVDAARDVSLKEEIVKIEFSKYLASSSTASTAKKVATAVERSSLLKQIKEAVSNSSSSSSSEAESALQALVEEQKKVRDVEKALEKERGKVMNIEKTLSEVRDQSTRDLKIAQESLENGLEEKNVSINTQREEIGKLVTQKNEAKMAAEAEKAALVDAKNKLKELERKNNEAVAKVNTNLEQQKRKNKDLTEQIRKLKLEESCETKSQFAKNNADKNTVLENQINEMQAELKDLEKAKEDVGKEKTEALSKAEKAELKVTEMEKSVEREKVKKARLETEVKNMQERLKQLEKANYDAVKKKTEALSKAAEAEESVRRMRTDLVELKAANETAVKDMNEAISKAEALKQSNEELNKELDLQKQELPTAEDKEILTTDLVGLSAELIHFEKFFDASTERDRIGIVNFLKEDSVRARVYLKTWVYGTDNAKSQQLRRSTPGYIKAKLNIYREFHAKLIEERGDKSVEKNLPDLEKTKILIDAREKLDALSRGTIAGREGRG